MFAQFEPFSFATFLRRANWSMVSGLGVALFVLIVFALALAATATST